MAIEHPKDADAAAEIVLTEVIPSMSKKLLPVTPPRDTSRGVSINMEGVFIYYVHAFPYHSTLLALKWFTDISNDMLNL